MMDREKAKNILSSVLHTDGAYMDYLDSEDVEAIKVLASDERPHGEWLPCKDDNFCKCSGCGQIVMSEERSNFCPNCGADMRKEGDKNAIKNGT